MRVARLFKNFWSAQLSLMKDIDKICKKTIVEYNKDERNNTKIDNCRIHTSLWYPDEEITKVDIQIWVADGFPKMCEEEVREIDNAFNKILNERLPCQRGFKIRNYIQNVTVKSDDD